MRDDTGGCQENGVPGPPWQDLLAEARRRIRTFVAEGSSWQLMSEDALLLAERLWTSSRDDDGAVPIEAAIAVADLYWHRSMAAPRPPGGDEDLGTAISIYAIIAAADEEAVPEELRPTVAEARRCLETEDPGSGRSAAVASAVDLLLAAETAYDDATVEEAIAQFRALLARLAIARVSDPSADYARLLSRDRSAAHGRISSSSARRASRQRRFESLEHQCPALTQAVVELVPRDSQAQRAAAAKRPPLS